MAYPLSIASLHFQYKTAFDVLKSYMPDKNDDELSQMVLDFKSKKDASKPKEPTEDTPKKVSKKTNKKDSPKEEPPKVESPKEEPPKVDSPKVESPTETPKKTKKSKV